MSNTSEPKASRPQPSGYYSAATRSGVSAVKPHLSFAWRNSRGDGFAATATRWQLTEGS